MPAVGELLSDADHRTRAVPGSGWPAPEED